MHLECLAEEELVGLVGFQEAIEIQIKVWDKGIGKRKENTFLLAYHSTVLKYGTSREKQWYVL